MRFVLPAGLLALALAAPWPAAGQERPPPGAVDAQDLVFLGDTRPVLLRLHVHVDGKPVQAVWRAYVRKWFDYLDRDGKGYLTRAQVQYAPKAPAFQALRQPGGFFFANPGTTLMPADLGKRLGDDKISLDDLIAYYARSGAGPVQATAPAGVNNAYQRVSQALFEHLDVNKDGKLSPEELFAGENLLRKLDADDDEMLSPQELLPSSAGPAIPPQRLTVGPPGPVAASSGFYVIPPGGNAAPLAALLLAHYDKDKNTRLSRAEVGLDRATFERLDVNNDGELDVEELARWHHRPADLELIVRIGKTAAGEPAADTYHPSGRRARLAGRVTKPVDGVLLLTLGDAQLNVLRGTPAAFRGNFNFQQFILQQFRAVDVKNRGYIDRDDLRTNNQAQVLRQIFTLVDRDGDGRMTEKELQAFLDLQAGAPASFVVLEILEKGRGLFEILDANRDGLLSVRELRTGWQRLAPLDKEGTGFVRIADIPRQFQLRVGTGGGPIRGAFPGLGSTGRAAPTKGPLWFRKMDRNGDGDVSLREFLGTRTDFERIDTDGDGLIDAAEAERADAWFREKLRRGK